jgi:hypothetical protein
VTAGDKVRCGTGLSNGKAATVGEGLSSEEVIDASGKIMLPMPSSPLGSGTMRHDMLQDDAGYTPYDGCKITE